MAFVWHLNAAAYGGIDSTFASFSLTDENANPRPAYRVVQDFVFSGHAKTVQ